MLDVEGEEMFYFQVSPLNGKSSEVADEKSVKLKTAYTSGFPHIFLTAQQWRLLLAYREVSFVKSLFFTLQLLIYF